MPNYPTGRIYKGYGGLFRRELDWVRRCSRTPAECARPICMEALDVDAVLAAAATVVMR